MPRYHVLLSEAGAADELRCVLRDLDEKELRKQFLKPHRSGHTLLCGGRVIPVESIRRVCIVATDADMQQSLSEANHESDAHRETLNRESTGLIFMGGRGYGPDDVSKIGTEVTSQFVTHAPGRVGAQGPLNRLLLNPWLVGIGGTVVAAGITAWLKWS